MTQQFESYLLIPHSTIGHQSLNDFKDTADIIGQLDLVISVDTAVTHLAASLNKGQLGSSFHSTQISTGCVTESDSPWYPGIMKLFRQSSHSDWSGVVDQLRRELDNLTLQLFKPCSRQISMTNILSLYGAIPSCPQ